MLTLSQTKEAIKDIGRRKLEKLLGQYDEAVIEAALELGIQLADIEECYKGRYKDDKDFAYSLAEETGDIDKNARWPQNCIDWEQAAKELMMDYSESNGHYFRNI